MPGRPRGAFSPLDVACPDCAAPAGQRCLTSDRAGRRSPHAARVTAARVAAAPAPGPRIPAHVSDAWTCPHPGCDRSYWPPAEWEPELWQLVLDGARRIHGRRHRQEAIDAADTADRTGPW